MSARDPSKPPQRILGRVAPAEFVGRAVELQRVVSHPFMSAEARGLLLLLAPSAGVSELLRQAYDQLFQRRENIIPIYFAVTRGETTAVSAAIEFLNTFVRQYVAYRRNEPSLCEASLTLNDLVQLALPADLEWIERLVEAYNRERFSNDDRAFVRFCLSAPQRVPRNGRLFVMLDGAQLAQSLEADGNLAVEMLRVFCRSNLSFAMAGLRRQLLEAAHRANCNFEFIDTLRLPKLAEEDARRLVEHVASRQRVAINEETRDLLVQQFESSPFFISALLQAARERNVSLESYLDCERLYTDELMGGRIHRYFSSLLEAIAPQPEVRLSLIRVLCDASAGEGRRASFDSWRKRLNIEASQLEKILHGLHIQEFINWDGAAIQAETGPTAWRDYLQTRLRMDILDQPRALVVADTIAEALKRAPRTMERHYRRIATLGWRDLLATFDCQRVPQKLFDFGAFSKAYKGVAPERVISGLESETELIRLPQVVHVAGCEAFAGDVQIGDPERCFIAHSFEGAAYTDASQIVWLVVDIESKLEAGADVVQTWLQRLELLAGKSGFSRTHVWLVSKEGFTEDALKAISKAKAYSSNRQQVELLSSLISAGRAAAKPTAPHDEFEMILPMGEDNELVAANTVEQIARRLNFEPEAINQIKHAIVEACINATEHSLSPDRKIYQRFRIESDKLVVTISSRGVVPSNLAAQNGELGTQPGQTTAAQERRGWGLKLIRSLMDEVEFERVDEGTSLRMTKYLRNSS